MDLTQELWVEKYRPKEIKDIIVPDEYDSEIKNFIIKKEIPNILLSGDPGSGKSTLARIITSSYGVLQFASSNLLEVNGSSKETRNIKFVSEVMEPFLRIPPAGGDKYKIIFIDEGDYLTEEAFTSLRGIIEKYQVKYGRFIITCNYVSKIPEPVRSRFTEYIFKKIPIEFIILYCSNILKSENKKFDEKDLLFTIEQLYPDVRKIVSTLQRNSLNDSFKINRNMALTSEKAIIASVLEITKYIKNGESQKINKEVSSINNILGNNSLEYRKIFYDLFKEPLLPVPAKVVINRYSSTFQSCLVPQMHLIAMVFEVIQTISNYYISIKGK